MTTPPPDAPQPDDALRYVLGNADDALAALDRARSALTTAVAYGRIALVRGNDDNTGETP
jgi:hypothetical protein